MSEISVSDGLTFVNLYLCCNNCCVISWHFVSVAVLEGVRDC